MVKKHPNIDALNQYILDVRDIPFNWHTNDCFMFTNNAFRAMYGQGWADDWVGKYIKNGKYLKRDELRKVFKADSLTEAIDRKLERIRFVPPRGALVTTNKARSWVISYALGICVGSSAVFLSQDGVISMPIEYTNDAWIKYG